MAAKNKKPMKGSIGTSFIIEKIPATRKMSCSKCIYYQGDGSCMKKPIVLSEVGYDFYKNCKDFTLPNTKSKVNKGSATETRGTRTVRSSKAKETRLVNNIRKLLYEKYNYNHVSKKINLSRLEALKLYEKHYPVYTGDMTKPKVIHMTGAGLSINDIAQFYNVNESIVRNILNESKEKVDSIKSDKNSIFNKSDTVKISKKTRISEIKSMIDNSKDLNFIGEKLNIDKYEVFKIYEKHYPKYKNLKPTKNVITEMNKLGLSYKNIADFYKVDKKYISNIMKPNNSINSNQKSVNKIKSKQRKKENIIKRLDSILGEDDILKKAQKNKQDYYDTGMKNINSNNVKSSEIISLTDKSGNLDIKKVKSHVSFLEKNSLVNRKELNKYYDIIDEYDKKDIKGSKKKKSYNI